MLLSFIWLVARIYKYSERKDASKDGIFIPWKYEGLPAPINTDSF